MLTDEQLAAALADLPGWQEDGPRIRRVYEFANFTRAMQFVHRVADLAEAQDHHPEILVQYRLVTLTLWSHDSGGVTKRDVRLAHAIDRKF